MMSNTSAVPFTPARVGDIVAVVSITTSFNRMTGPSQKQQIELARVTKVDAAGYVERIKVRPHFRTQPLLQRGQRPRTAAILHDDCKVARKAYNAIWRESDNVWVDPKPGEVRSDLARLLAE